MDKDRFEAFCTDAMLLIHEVVDYAASPPAGYGRGAPSPGRCSSQSTKPSKDEPCRHTIRSLRVRYKRSAKPGSATILSASSSRREIATPSHKENNPRSRRAPSVPYSKVRDRHTSALRMRVTDRSGLGATLGSSGRPKRC